MMLTKILQIPFSPTKLIEANYRTSRMKKNFKKYFLTQFLAN